jgi:3',5'-cyclic-AMP phosphodiesterase
MLICQLTDLHVRPPGGTSNRIADTNVMTERAFRAVAALRPRPDVVLITGDAADCGMVAEYANLTAMLRRTLDLPVLLIPGNHDHRGHFRAGLAAFRGVTAHPDYVQYAVEDLPLRLVMLDTLVPGTSHGLMGEDRLAWLDRTLAQAPERPTLVAMHHPPFRCGVAPMDRINLHDHAAFAAVIARHPQVCRIICGHHHRAITAPVAHTIATVAPGVAHQIEFSLNPDDPGAIVLEPPAYALHLWTPDAGVITHTVYVEAFPGPYPFLPSPDKP